MSSETNTPALDSSEDTKNHIARVDELLRQCSSDLLARGQIHDASKLLEPEKSGFDRLKALSLSGMTYGSPEYRECLRKEQPAIDHHYAHNPHHPEYYGKFAIDENHIVSKLEARVVSTFNVSMLSPEDQEIAAFIALMRKIAASSVDHMNLFDVMEMLMDWKAASERMKDGGDIRASIEHNAGRFGMSPQLKSIFLNTVSYLGW